MVHINAGAAALALALVVGPRLGFGRVAFKPHNLPFVLLGSALLWFGWFGFNAGSEFGADATAGRAFLNTLVAPAAAMLAWCLVERIRDGKATSLGAASGIVGGLVAITPAAAAVDTYGALAIGFFANLDEGTTWAPEGALNGLLYGGDVTQLVSQALAAAFALAVSFVGTAIIALLIKATVGFRVSSEIERGSIDIAQHGEAAYEAA